MKIIAENNDYTLIMREIRLKAPLKEQNIAYPILSQLRTVF